jgi:hypothetical protein
MKDFTKTTPDTPQEKPISFKIDDDIFYAYPRIGAELLRGAMETETVGAMTGIDMDNLNSLPQEDQVAILGASNRQFARIFAFLDEVLLPDSAQLFATRLGSAAQPIDMSQVFGVWQYLISEYGENPTRPSLPSRNGRDLTGVTSTAGAPLKDSILPSFLHTDT